MILYLASDLLWASKIKGTADALGLPCRPARNPEMLRARLADSPVRALLIDLDAGAPALELLTLARAEAPNVRILAFGPHVMTEALAAAQHAGAHAVMARGAFSANLPEILMSLSSGNAVATQLHD
ncbi:hypothetical protein [Synechococcus sp. Cruz CV-v-12]|uniref:hypothetical protein n=1 Tax=Synechococcus sp. Cruz CV-v-12 TaxID=2823728 RepID=UPI0020CC1CF6|nr:hypothetical protein [Synechococcus sp. Cruz CV-v-12]MCP9874833.1 hypothetical protein [Synechococcus sp. Cruz CV-v-12]